MFEPIKITLKSPIQHGDETISTLTIGREMVAGDLRGISVSNLKFDDIYEVASRLTGVPTPIIKTMKMSDFMMLSNVVTDFFEDSPAIGGNV